MSLIELGDWIWTKPEDESLRSLLQEYIDKTTQDSAFCVETITNKAVFSTLTNVLNKAAELSYMNVSTNQIRLLKGFVMLLRNISIQIPSKTLSLQDYQILKSSFASLSLSFVENCQTLTEIKYCEKDVHAIQLASIAAQSVLNFTDILNFEPLGIESDIKSFKALSLVIDKGGVSSINIESLGHRLSTYISPEHDELRTSLFYSGKQELTWLLLSLSEAAIIRPGIDLETFFESSKDNKVLELRKLLIDFIKNLFTHESFGGILCKMEKDNEYIPRKNELRSYSSVPLIFLCQLVCDSELLNENTDSLSLISLASWLLEYFSLVKQKSEHLLNKKTLNDDEKSDLQWCHRKLIATLDIMATYSELNVIVKIFDEYNLIKDLITLFRVIENNTLKPKLKDNFDPNLLPGQIINGSKKYFPQVKSIIIELMTALIHCNKSNQDVVRDLHGLELILNNCNLDMNEPYIKERSILCIKYLLDDNKKNQEFVASLEAQGTEINKETDEILTKAGFEVDIVDGKIKLKKSEKREQIEQKVTELK